MLRILYNFIKKTFACDSRMSGVVSRINKHENPVIKLLVIFSCLENFRLYSSFSDMKFAAVQMIWAMNWKQSSYEPCGGRSIGYLVTGNFQAAIRRQVGNNQDPGDNGINVVHVNGVLTS